VSVSYGASVVYDVVVFLLALARLHRAELLRDSPFGRKLCIDSLLYVAVAAAVNTTVFIVLLLPDSFQFLKPSVVPFSVVVTVSIRTLSGTRLQADMKITQTSMSQRVYLNLRLYDFRQQAGVGVQPAAPESEATLTRPSLSWMMAPKIEGGSYEPAQPGRAI
jgi:hypothetical protein